MKNLRCTKTKPQLIDGKKSIGLYSVCVCVCYADSI